MRYFFDVLDASGVSSDEEGIECPSAGAAVREAANAAAAMSEDLVPAGGGNLAIEVRDREGLVAVITIAMEIKSHRR